MSAHPLDFHSTGEFSPAKTPFSGVHHSDNDITNGVLQGSRRGSSPQASDAHRIHLGQGAPAGSHVYRRGNAAHPSIGSRKNVYEVSGNKAIANIDSNPARTVFGDALTSAYKDAISSGADPQTAKFTAQNAAEHALLMSGYDGYESPKSQPGGVFLFGDTKIDSTGAQHNAKTSGAVTT